MAFPTIPTVAAGRVLTGTLAGTTATRFFPAMSGLTKNSGDLLLAIIVAYQTSTGTNAAFSGWPTGWTEFHDSATSTTMAIGMAYKWSDGTETGQVSVTQAGTITGHAATFMLSISGAHASTVPEAGSRASGTTTNVSVGTFNPAGWGVEDTLWIGVASAGETATTGSWTSLGAEIGAIYTNTVVTGQSGDVLGGVEGGVGFRQEAIASSAALDWAHDTSNSRWGGLIVAVRPAAVSITGTSTQTLANATSTTTGVYTPAPITGTSARTLANATSTTTGVYTPAPITGTSTQTLANATSTASGSYTAFSGTSATTLANATSTTTGVYTPAPITGTSTQTLANATSTASGTNVIPGYSLGYTRGYVSIADRTGTSATTLANATSTASGTNTAFIGTSARTLANATSTSSGTNTPPPITGTSSTTLAGHQATTTGQFTSAGGILASTLANATSTAAGIYTPPLITGTGSPTLAPVVSTGLVVYAQTGTASAGLADIVSNGMGTAVSFIGTGTAIVAPATSSGNNTYTPPPIAGTITINLANFLSSGVATRADPYAVVPRPLLGLLPFPGKVDEFSDIVLKGQSRDIPRASDLYREVDA